MPPQRIVVAARAPSRPPQPSARRTPRRAPQSRARRAGRAGGFTLIEVVVGLSILLIGSLGLVAAIVTTIQTGRVAREHTLALGAAEDRMSGAVVATETELLALDGQTFTVTGLAPRADGTPVGSIEVLDVGAPLYRVEVRVRWRGPYGDEALSLDSTVVPR